MLESFANYCMTFSQLLVATMCFVLVLSTDSYAQVSIKSIENVCDPSTGETAEEIFRAAQAKWAQSESSQDLIFQIAVSLTEGSETFLRRYDGNLQSNIISVSSFSVEEQADPMTPHGINAYITLQGHVVKRLSAPNPSYDLIGIPKLSPTYSFGIADRQPSDAVRSDENQNENTVRTIATTVAHGKAYDVTCSGSNVESDGTRVNTLFLRPLFKPDKFRLRELIVQSQSYWLLGAKVHGNFKDGPPLHCDWNIEFAHDRFGEYIKNEQALGVLDYGKHKYSNAQVSFENVSPMPRRQVYLSVTFSQSTANEVVEPL